MAIRSRVGVEVDTTGLQAHLQDYVKIMGKEMSVVIKQQAGLFCRDMISYTRPFGGKNAGGTGLSRSALEYEKQNIKAQVEKVFRPIEKASPSDIANIGSYDVFKMWEQKMLGSSSGLKHLTRWSYFQGVYGGNAFGATKYFSSGSVSQMNAYMNGLRTDNGRGNLARFVYAKNKGAFAIVQTQRDMDYLIKQKEEHIGILKSAYWFAAQRIGAKITVPAWAKRTQGDTNSIGVDNTKKSDGTPDVVVGNIIGNKLGNERWTRIAIKQRAFKMRNQMAAYMNKNKIPWWNASNTWQHFDIK